MEFLISLLIIITVIALLAGAASFIAYLFVESIDHSK